MHKLEQLLPNHLFLSISINKKIKFDFRCVFNFFVSSFRNCLKYCTNQKKKCKQLGTFFSLASCTALLTSTFIYAILFHSQKVVLGIYLCFQHTFIDVISFFSNLFSLSFSQARLLKLSYLHV